MMMTVMRVTISRRDTADTTITDEILSLHVSTKDIGSSYASYLPKMFTTGSVSIIYLLHTQDGLVVSGPPVSEVGNT